MTSHYFVLVEAGSELEKGGRLTFIKFKVSQERLIIGGFGSDIKGPFSSEPY
jgi:hypothetical protein